MEYKKPLVLDYELGIAREIKASETNSIRYIIELDFGSLPVVEKSFNVIDVNVSNVDIVKTELAPLKPTDKDIDELEFDSFDIISFANNGSIDIFVKSLEGEVSGKFKFMYEVLRGII